LSYGAVSGDVSVSEIIETVIQIQSITLYYIITRYGIIESYLSLSWKTHIPAMDYGIRAIIRKPMLKAIFWSLWILDGRIG
jgi:hypothetical protein